MGPTAIPKCSSGRNDAERKTVKGLMCAFASGQMDPALAEAAEVLIGCVCWSNQRLLVAVVQATTAFSVVPTDT